MNNEVPGSQSPDRPVLVCIDGSDIALRALDRAIEEARVRGTRVRLIGVYPVVGVGDPGLEQRFREAVTAENTEHLNAAQARAGAAGTDVDVVAGEGDAAKAIIKAAKDACLVVMGKRGKGGALRGRLGSVSAAVAAHSPVPVIVVPPQATDDSSDVESAREAAHHKDIHISGHGTSEKKQTPASEIDFTGSVVVGVDAAGARNPAVARAVDYAQAHGCALSLVSVNGALSGTPDWFQDQYNQTYYFDESLRKLNQIAEELAQQNPDLTVTHHGFLGRPGRVLVQATRTADLVVVGSRGIGGFTGLLLGSVSQSVLGTAAGPVMVVPNRD